MAYQLSLLEQARHRHPGADDPTLIAEISDQLIDELAERPPISLEVVASSRDIAEIRFEPMSNPASLTPEREGLVMRLRANDSWARQRFGGFHEVGHTFQPGYYEQRLFRCAHPSASPRRVLDPETLSDLAAAELLLPEKHFAPTVVDDDFGFASIMALSKLYQASVQATTYRYSHFWPEPSLVVCLEPGLRKDEQGDPEAEERLRVVSAWPGSGRWPFVPKNKSASDGSALCRALEGELIHEAASLAELEIDGPEHLELATRAFRYRDSSARLRRRVLALYRQVERPRSHLERRGS
jgi:hypothetical protein